MMYLTRSTFDVFYEGHHTVIDSTNLSLTRKQPGSFYMFRDGSICIHNLLCGAILPSVLTTYSYDNNADCWWTCTDSLASVKYDDTRTATVT